MLNKVILIGHVGQDPEIKKTGQGKEFAVFSLATTERWKVRETGEKKEKTDWHRVVVFNDHLVPVVKERVRKGSKLYLEGQLTTRKWQDDSGVEKYATEINLKFRSALVLLDKREGGSGGPDDSVYDEE